MGRRKIGGFLFLVSHKHTHTHTSSLSFIQTPLTLSLSPTRFSRTSSTQTFLPSLPYPVLSCHFPLPKSKKSYCLLLGCDDTRVVRRWSKKPACGVGWNVKGLCWLSAWFSGRSKRKKGEKCIPDLVALNSRCANCKVTKQETAACSIE